MNREIKFRVWNLVYNRWLNFHEVLFDMNGMPVDVDGLGDVSPIMGLRIMQYTGLKDKNGKEIYEGDVLVRIFNDGSKGRTILCKDIRDVFLTNNIADDIHEIIGNVYENPELIEGV